MAFTPSSDRASLNDGIPAYDASCQPPHLPTSRTRAFTDGHTDVYPAINMEKQFGLMARAFKWI